MTRLIAVLLAAAAATAPEYKKAEGTWRVVGMEMNGEAIPAEGFKDLRMELKGNSVRAIIGRCSNLTEKQIEKLRAHLDAVKKAARQPRPVEVQKRVSEVAALMI